MKNPTIATVLNIIPGFGYLYVGGEKKVFGSLLLVGLTLSIISSFDPLLYSEEYMNAPMSTWGMVAVLSLIVTIAAFMYDGYVCAISHNKNEERLKS